MTNTNIDDMKVVELRKELKDLDVPAGERKGRKAELQERLREARAAEAAKAAEAETATAEVEAAEATNSSPRRAGRPDPPGIRNDEGAGANERGGGGGGQTCRRGGREG